MQWQGYLRQMSKFYKHVIVYGRSTSAYLYKDFASEFRAMDVSSWDTDAYLLRDFDYLKWANQFKGQDILIADNRCKELSSIMHQDFISYGAKKKANEYDLIIHARDIPFLKGNKKKSLRNWSINAWDQLCSALPQLKIASVGIQELSYAPKGTDDLKKANEYDLIIHARNIPFLKGNKKKSLRNWSINAWDQLCSALPQLKIASVGIQELSYAPKGTDDLRGISTEQLCSILASSKCCVGPSSGLMHLALRYFCNQAHIFLSF